MGCSVTKSRSPGAICSNMRTRPTASSSGLQLEGSSSHFLDRNSLDKEKGSALGTSSGNSPDSARGVEFSKVPQKTSENPTMARQRPRDQENHDFSFKVNTESSIEKEKDKKLVTSGNQSLFRPVEVNSRKKDRNTTEYLSKFAPNVIENKTSEEHNVNNGIPNPTLGGISFAAVREKENENIQTPVKSEIDQVGLAFSFMNLRQSNVNQPTLFYDQEAENNASERIGQYFNMARSSVFGVKGNEAEKLTESQKKRAISICDSSVSSVSCQSPAKNNTKFFKEAKDVAQSSNPGSLSVIDPVEELTKVRSIPISNTFVATSTNVATQRTVTSIANLCLDEAKKSALAKKFTLNLVTLVKPAGALAGIQMNATKSLNTVPQTSTSNLNLNSLAKVQSTPNFDLKCNLFGHRKSKQEDEIDDKLILKREQTADTKAPNMQDRSFDLSALDIQEDSNEPSPIAEGSFPNITKSNTPKTLLLSHGNTSFSRHVGESTILDRTIYPLEDNITRMDLDRYSINIEMGEREDLIGSPEKSPVIRKQGRRLSNSFNLLSKAKSVILDSQVNSATPTIPQKRNLENFYSRPKSFCEIDQDAKKANVLSGDVYLSPHRIPAHSLTRMPQERSMTQDLDKTTPSVIETSRADKSVDDEGQKKINQYLLIKDLGRGGFGKVKLAIHCDTKEQYAIKISNKSKLKRKMLSRSKSAYSLLAKEVAIMKKMDHPNIVRLMEVIDDPNHNNLYIAMEFVKKGAVLSKTYWKHEMAKKQDVSEEEESTSRGRFTKLTEEKAKKYFRHLILALDYLHNTVGIIHRDIKPENLLISADDTLKISDFGISEIMEGNNDTLDTNAGTKLYLAPEAWKGKSFRGKPADIWAAGGTLYYLLTGRPPFQGMVVDDIKRKILDDELQFPTDLEISSGAKDLIRACLTKDPQERITLEEIMQDNWLTENGRDPLENNPRVDLTLSEEDLKKALTKISFMAVVYVTATLKKAHRAKLNVRRKKTQEASLINESQKQG